MPGTIFYRDFAPGTYTFSVDTCGTDMNQSSTLKLLPGVQYEFEYSRWKASAARLPARRRYLLCPPGAATFSAAVPAAARLSRRALRRKQRHPFYRRSTIIFLISAIAFAGLRFLGQVLVQFMMVWQR